MKLDGSALRRDQPADQPAEADPEVHADPLQRVGVVPRLAAASGARAARLTLGQKRAVPIPIDRGDREACHGWWTSGKQRVAERCEQEPDRERPPAADRSTSGPTARARRRAPTTPSVATTSPAVAEPNPAHVVEVDEQ